MEDIQFLADLIRNDKYGEFTQQCHSMNYDFTSRQCCLFRTACVMNKLVFAQYMYDVCPVIKVHAHGYEAFRYACGNGNMEMVQWLLSIDPNVDYSYNDYEAFRYAVHHNHYQMAVWLKQYCSDFMQLNDYYFHVDKMQESADRHKNMEMKQLLESIFTESHYHRWNTHYIERKMQKMKRDGTYKQHIVRQEQTKMLHADLESRSTNQVKSSSFVIF